MTATHVIMLVGIATSAAVALIIASQQRKQMRQIELCKQDPTVGLVPPSSALTRFIKSKWDIVLGLGGPIVSLTLEFISNTPVTRVTVLLISFSVAILLVNLVMAILFRVIDRIVSTMGRLTNIVDNSVAITKEHFEVTKTHTQLIKKLSGLQSLPSDGT